MVGEGLKIESNRRPTPFLSYRLQTTRQKLTHAKHLLDHREGTLTDVTSDGVNVCRFGLLHLRVLTFDCLFVLAAIDLAMLGLAAAEAIR